MIVLPPRARDLVAPLGLAFLDGPGGAPVLNGLSVRAWPAGGEARVVAATVNAAGVAGFHRLPGLQFDPADPFAGDPRQFVVEVADVFGRFQAGRVVVNAPAKGVTIVALYPTPIRPVPPGRLGLRAELWDSVNDRPAAYALLTVKLAANGNGTGAAAALTVVAAGLADDRGRVLAVGDWPTPKPPTAAAVPDGAPAPPPPRWDAPRKLVVEVRFHPDARPDNPAPPPRVLRLDRVPDLSLTPARVLKLLGPAGRPTEPPELAADGPTVFKSADDGLGRLLVTSP